MKRIINILGSHEKGFTLIELLVVIAILGVLAAVAVPNVGKFISKGKVESYNAELHNLQTAVMAMMEDSDNGTLDGGLGPNGEYEDIQDMDVVTANGGTFILSDYMTGLNTDGTVKTDCTYLISKDGGVILQSTP